MDYNIIFSPKAQKEIENAINFYFSRSSNASKNLLIELKKCYTILKINPYFKINYKDIRSLKLKKYPYSIYFYINEKQKIIKIVAFFQLQQNPVKEI